MAGPGWRVVGETAGLSNVVAISAGGSHSLALVQQSSNYVTAPFNYLAAPCGSDIRLDTEVAQAGLLYCQWSFDGTALPVATNSSLLLQNAQTNQSGAYSIVVSNNLGQVVHAVDFLSVVPVLVTVAPRSQTNFAGTTVNLSVTALSTVPFSYQWRFAGTNLPGATKSSLALTGIMPNQEGKYTVLLSNSYGTVTSPEANIGVINVVQWAGVFSSVTNAGDATAVSINGNRTLFVARVDGSVIAWILAGSGPVNLPYGLANVVAVAAGGAHTLALRSDGRVIAWGYNESGQAKVPADLSNVVAIAAGNVHSLALRADGTVAAWGNNDWGQTNIPTGLSHVVAIAATYNGNLALTSDGNLVVWGKDISGGDIVIPSGSTNLVQISGADYHFLALRNDGKVIDSAGQANIPANLTNIVSVAAGSESLALTSNGNVIEWGSFAARNTNLLAKLSNVVAIASGGGSLALIGSGAPHLTVPPVNRAAARGVTTSFRVAAVGQPPLIYQWQFNGTDLLGETNAVSTITNIQPEHAGVYTVMVSNSLGSARASAYLDVAPVLINAVAVQPATRPFAAGTSILLTAAAQGMNLQYQWLVDGVPIPGATDSSLSLTNIQISQAGAYSVTVSNILGQVSSAELPLDVLPLWIDFQSSNKTNFAGGNLLLSVFAAGSSPISLQWQFNGVPIEGATGTTLSLSNLQLNQSGVYSAIVSNAFGITNSQPIYLDVEPCIFLYQAGYFPLPVGQRSYFSHVINGIGPFTYQWQFNGMGIPGATNNFLDLTNLTLQMTGDYSLSVSNAYGIAISPVFRLVVINIEDWQSDSTAAQNLLSVPGNITSIAASSAGWWLAARGDGTVTNFSGQNISAPSPPLDLSDALVVSAGRLHAVALRIDGTVVAWGDNTFGQTNVPPELIDVVSVAAGEFHNLALKSDGRVIAWGNDAFGQTNIPSGLSNIVAVAAGTNASLALSRDGQIIAWGADNLGHAIALPSGLTNLLAVAAGQSFFVALRDDHSAMVWHNDSDPFTPPDLTNLFAIAVKGDFDLELTADGTLTSWVNSNTLPVGISNVAAIAIGGVSVVLLDVGPPIISAPLFNPVHNNGTFSVSLATQIGRVYGLEYKNSLTEAHWTGLPLVAGNGHVQTFSDQNAGRGPRFYRVRQW